MLKFLLVVILFAAAVYALMWALERRRTGGSGRPSGLTLPNFPKSPRPPTKQVAPDDDEDFLRWLDKKRKRDSPE